MHSEREWCGFKLGVRKGAGLTDKEETALLTITPSVKHMRPVTKADVNASKPPDVYTRYNGMKYKPIRCIQTNNTSGDFNKRQVDGNNQNSAGATYPMQRTQFLANKHKGFPPGICSAPDGAGNTASANTERTRTTANSRQQQNEHGLIEARPAFFKEGHTLYKEAVTLHIDTLVTEDKGNYQRCVETPLSTWRYLERYLDVLRKGLASLGKCANFKIEQSGCFPMAECLESDETESVADPNLGFVKAPRPTRETSCNFQSRFMIEDDNNILGVEKNVHPLSCFFKNQSSRPRVTQVEDNNDVLGVDQNLHPPRCSKYFEQQNPSLPQATLDIIHSSKTDPDNASLYESHKRDTSVQYGTQFVSRPIVSERQREILMDQILAKIGIMPKRPNDADEFKNTLVVGYDVGAGIRGFVGMYVNKKDRFELVQTMRPVRGEICGYGIQYDMGVMIRRYINRRKAMPERIIIYRDGVGDPEFEEVISTEVAHITKAIRRQNNPPSWWDFFLVTAQGNVGELTTPSHYTVLHHGFVPLAHATEILFHDDRILRDLQRTMAALPEVEALKEQCTRDIESPMTKTAIIKHAEISTRLYFPSTDSIGIPATVMLADRMVDFFDRYGGDVQNLHRLNREMPHIPYYL
eukprot:scpid34019/ scgid0445/ 